MSADTAKVAAAPQSAENYTQADSLNNIVNSLITRIDELEAKLNPVLPNGVGDDYVSEDAQPGESDLAMNVRRLANLGWRIAGITRSVLE